jgi:hypothetical protein
MESENKSLWATPATFVRGCLVITIAAVVCAGVMMAVATFAIYRERDLALRAAERSAALADCTLERARLEGRVHSFEAVFISTKRTAIDAALREFIEHTGGETDAATLKQFEDWLRRTHP